MRAHHRVALLAIFSTIVVAAPASAATFNVSSPANDGAGTLRSAISAANQFDDKDDIRINAGVTPTFTAAPPVIGYPVAIFPDIPGGRSAIDLGGHTGLDLNYATTGSSLTRLDIRNNKSDSGAAVNVRSDGVVTLDDLRIGLTADGTGDAGGYVGVQDSGTGTVIEDSVISGQTIGLLLGGEDGQITRNRVGTNAAGTTAVANTQGGVWVSSGSDYRIGVGEDGGNVVAGNGGYGIKVQDGSSFNRIQGNRIGITAAGTPLGNAGDGIQIIEASNVIVGSTEASPGPNVIAHNGGNGIAIALLGIGSERGNFAYFNSIHSNTQMSIDLKDDGLLEPNDAGDVDAGPNELQNHPIITSARGDVLSGTIDSPAGKPTTIDVYSDTAVDQPSGAGELRTVRCRTLVPAGGKTWSCSPRTVIPGGEFASALATTDDGTSEPSPSVFVNPAPVADPLRDEPVVPVTTTTSTTTSTITAAATTPPATTTAIVPPVPGYGRALLEGFARSATLSVRGVNRRGGATLTITLPAPAGAQPVIYRVSGTARISRRRTAKLPARTATVRAGRAGRVVYRLRVPPSLRSARVKLTATATAGSVAATRTRTGAVRLARR